jgi:hypothetical protein
MLLSRPIQPEGRFLGVAVQSAADWHVVAIDPVIEDLHGMRFASAEEATRMAEKVLRRARRLPAAPGARSPAGPQP